MGDREPLNHSAQQPPSFELPEGPGDEDFRLLWRWTKNDHVLTVKTRARSKSCAEIWITEEQVGQPISLSRETFETSAECEQFLLSRAAQLESDGWRKDT
jgi:hypothetical protein